MVKEIDYQETLLPTSGFGGCLSMVKVRALEADIMYSLISSPRF
jgi:hypothetical protein